MRRKSISLDNIRSFFTILAREVDCVALFITKAILRGEIFSLRNFTILLRYPVDLLSRIGYFSSLIAPKTDLSLKVLSKMPIYIFILKIHRDKTNQSQPLLKIAKCKTFKVFTFDKIYTFRLINVL